MLKYSRPQSQPYKILNVVGFLEPIMFLFTSV